MEDGEDDGEDERELEDDNDSTRPRGRRTIDSEGDAASSGDPAYDGLAHAHEASPGPKLRAEDFPLPPSTNVHDTSGATSLPNQTSVPQTVDYPSQTPPHRQTVTMLADDLADGPQTPTANTYNPQAQAAQMSGTTAASNGGSPFRALPLLPHDLPRTRILVTSSSVRPNERGKDVLSFVVYVDPNGVSDTTGGGKGKGKGKEGWSVEKMYSDVLGLDQRVRARVGKSVGKRIANLPDGKLWRDHAPSKVDQRKVSDRCPCFLTKYRHLCPGDYLLASAFVGALMVIRFLAVASDSCWRYRRSWSNISKHSSTFPLRITTKLSLSSHRIL